jgi:hypothetical protein
MAKWNEELADQIERAKERLKIIEAESIRLKKFISGGRDVLAALDQEHAKTTSKLPFENLPAIQPEHSLATLSIKDAALAVLRSSAQPMTVKELLKAMGIGGKIVGGKVPSDTLRATLRSYDDIFKQDDDHRWRSVEEEGTGEKREGVGIKIEP